VAIPKRGLQELFVDVIASSHTSSERGFQEFLLSSSSPFPKREVFFSRTPTVAPLAPLLFDHRMSHCYAFPALRLIAVHAS
jgi:hypothetical protein